MRVGSARATRTETGEAHEFFNTYLFTSPARVKSAELKQLPLFRMDDIGGVAGVARWLRLNRAYPRAVAPIVGRVRTGREPIAVGTLNLAAAIEYWVKVHKGAGRLWPSRGKNWAHAIALKIGTVFESWVGDSTKLTQLFWDHYNGLKHDPHFTYSASDLALMNEAAYYLLICALLNRVANSKAPSRALLRHHRVRRLGERIRILVK